MLLMVRVFMVCLVLGCGAIASGQDRFKEPEKAPPIPPLDNEYVKISETQRLALKPDLPTLQKLKLGAPAIKAHTIVVSVLKDKPAKNTIADVEKLEVDADSTIKNDAYNAIQKVFDNPGGYHPDLAVIDKAVIVFKERIIKVDFTLPNVEINAADQLAIKAEFSEALAKIRYKPRYESFSTFYGGDGRKLWFGVATKVGEELFGNDMDTAVKVVENLFKGQKQGLTFNADGSLTFNIGRTPRTIYVRIYMNKDKEALKVLDPRQAQEIALMWRRHVDYVENERDKEIAAIPKPVVDPLSRPEIRMVELTGNDLLQTNFITLRKFITETVKGYDEFDKVLAKYSPELSDKIKADWDTIKVNKLTQVLSVGADPGTLPNNVFGTISIISGGNLKIAEDGFLKFGKNYQAAAIVYYSLLAGTKAKVDAAKMLTMVQAVHFAVDNEGEREKLTQAVFDAHLKQVVVSPQTDGLEQIIADLKKTKDTFKSRLGLVNLSADVLLGEWDNIVKALQVEHAKSLNRDLKAVLGADRGLSPAAAAEDERLKLKRRVNQLIDTGKFTTVELERGLTPPPPPVPAPVNPVPVNPPPKG